MIAAQTGAGWSQCGGHAADLCRPLYVEVFGLREEVEPAVDVNHRRSCQRPLQRLLGCNWLAADD